MLEFESYSVPASVRSTATMYWDSEYVVIYTYCTQRYPPSTVYTVTRIVTTIQYYYSSTVGAITVNDFVLSFLGRFYCLPVTTRQNMTSVGLTP